MTQTKPEPLNLKLIRITPTWAKRQSARRALVIAMYTLPFVAGVLSVQTPLARVFAGLGVIATITCFAWLVGATSARADMPDEYLDERERSQRDRVYRLSFINLMGLIALAFVISRFVPQAPLLSGDTVIGLLFFFGMLMPTAVLAWIEPDPILED
jgi:Ca2+/Na+ antiporter